MVSACKPAPPTVRECGVRLSAKAKLADSLGAFGVTEIKTRKQTSESQSQNVLQVLQELDLSFKDRSSKHSFTNNLTPGFFLDPYKTKTCWAVVHACMLRHTNRRMGFQPLGLSSTFPLGGPTQEVLFVASRTVSDGWHPQLALIPGVLSAPDAPWHYYRTRNSSHYPWSSTFYHK